MLRLCLTLALLAPSCGLLSPHAALAPAHAQRLRGAASVPVLARSSQRARAIVASDADASAAAAAAAPPEVPPVVPAAEEAAAAVDASLLERASEAAGAVYRLSRPHTIRGTLLACFTGVGRALIESPSFVAMLPALLPRAMLGVLALLLGNLFIVGINQIYDVEIDEINKPYLPIAAGRISPKAAWAIVLGSGISALALVKSLFSPLIFALFAFGTAIGGLYSVPPFQLKRFPLAAGLTIATCRGFLLNFGVYYATREALGLTFSWSAPVSFLARFMTGYAAVIAVTKDLSDVEGDKKGGIQTYAARFGPAKVAYGASIALGLNYVHAIATALLSAPGTFHRAFMAIGHGLAALWLARSTQKLQPDDSGSVKQYYKQIWNLFYLEYAMYPFI